MRWNLEYIKWKIKNFREGREEGGSIGTKKNPETFVGSMDVIDVHENRWPFEEQDRELYYYKDSEVTGTAEIMAEKLGVELIPVERR